MSNEIEGVSLDGSYFEVGAKIGDRVVTKIYDFKNGVDDPRNGFSWFGFTGVDEDGKTIFEIRAITAVIYYK